MKMIDNKSLMDIVTKTYDGGIIPLAVTFGVDLHNIITKNASDVGKPTDLPKMFGWPEVVDADLAAKNAYHQLVKACEAAYFAGISRSAAEAIIRALPGGIHIRLCDTIQLDSTKFISGWNDAHPDEKPVHIPEEWLLTI